MVLNLFKKKVAPDPYLTRPIQTERFNLVHCNRREAIKITLPWREDKEVLHNLMMRKAGYGQVAWVKAIGKPNGHTLFYHAIVSKELRGTIGAHRVTLNKSGTASMAIVIHARDWWGKDVFREVRTAMMDHFAGSDRVNRFYGRVLSRNFSSIYNYSKLGFRHSGYDRQAWHSPVTDELCDTMHYEMLKEDWLQLRNLSVKQ